MGKQPEMFVLPLTKQRNCNFSRDGSIYPGWGNPKSLLLLFSNYYKFIHSSSFRVLWQHNDNSLILESIDERAEKLKVFTRFQLFRMIIDIQNLRHIRPTKVYFLYILINNRRQTFAAFVLQPRIIRRIVIIEIRTITNG